MDMRHMPMAHMHNTFWRNDQVNVIFRSAIPLITTDGISNTDALLKNLDLPLQLQKLNQFLQESNVPVTLHFLDDNTDTNATGEGKPSSLEQYSIRADQPSLPPGVYPFGLATPIQSDYGEIHTSVLCFLKFEQPASASGPAATSAHENGHGDEDNHSSPVPLIVNTLNASLEDLNSSRQVPLVIAAPHIVTGGTGGIGQGCPLTPPIPVADSCSNWHIELSDLSSDIQAKTGNGVTVFILDSFPERGIIARAARDAGDDNALLCNIDQTATFDYSFLSGVQEIDVMGATNDAAVGKDVYGQHYAIQLADHGLFIAGIVRDIAPDAKIECVRVLDDLCVGDLNTIANALQQIYNRKALSTGDLYQKPVVINLSLVIPTEDEVGQAINTSAGGFNVAQAPLYLILKSLVDIGVVIAASAGNEGDLREMPGGNRPDALYPAAYGNPPYKLEGVIPVGAVDGNGKATSYSCYPGPFGIATYGGEVPNVPPPPVSNPVVDISDALRGIYSSVEYPPLSAEPPEQYYTAPNNHCWAYWVGTSFATPIIAGLTARVLEKQQTTALLGSVRENVAREASFGANWDRLSDGMGGTRTETGRAIRAVQSCQSEDCD